MAADETRKASHDVLLPRVSPGLSSAAIVLRCLIGAVVPALTSALIGVIVALIEVIVALIGVIVALIGVIVALIGVIAADILAGVADCGFNAQVMDRWPTFKKE